MILLEAFEEKHKDPFLTFPSYLTNHKMQTL